MSLNRRPDGTMGKADECERKPEEERPVPLQAGAVKGEFRSLWPHLFCLLGAVIGIRVESKK